MIRRLLVITAATLTLFACASTDDRYDPESRIDTTKERYTAAPGPSPVGAIPEVTLHDAARNKDLGLSIEYPTRSANNPLIIFSHGFGGSQREYVGLSSQWTSYGYVVIKPTHADAGGLPSAKSIEDVWASQTQNEWRNRVRDISLIIDSLDTLEERYPELKGKIDHTKIGVGGHSYGAYTAMLIGGAKTFPGGVSYADPRVKAIVLMSPQGPSDIRGLTNESFATINVPALFMTGTRDQTSETETAEWRQKAYELAPAGDKWLLSIEGARHGSFTGRMDQLMEMAARERNEPSAGGVFGDPNADEMRRRPRTRSESAMFQERDIFRRIQTLSLAFWDLYLKGDANGRTQLENAKAVHK